MKFMGKKIAWSQYITHTANPLDHHRYNMADFIPLSVLGSREAFASPTYQRFDDFVNLNTAPIEFDHTPVLSNLGP